MGVRGALLMGVLFSADLAEDTGMALPFTPSNRVSRKYNVYETWLGPHPAGNTYWTDWGGWYDNPTINLSEVYIGGVYLVRVGSLEDCCLENNSIYDEPDAGTVYINVPKHTWLYDDEKTDYRKTVSFLSGPKNPGNPSDSLFNGEHWKVKLDVPKFTVKLSDVISGLTKYPTFDFVLFNNDGYFDDLETTNFFNSPSYIKKTWKENPAPEDFIPIRHGMVESIKIDDKTMTVSCADIFRTLEEPVSKTVKDIFAGAAENTDEELPLVYGTVKITLIQINDSQYVAGENIVSVSAVYDKDGNAVSFSFDNGIITSSAEDVESALVTGSTENKIGRIVVDMIAGRTNVKYLGSFWDRNETDVYINSSPPVNIAFTGGTVREAVRDALSSDMVFLIQKNDGRFTLRKWGKTYNTFNINSWKITKFPVKNYSEAQKNYLSGCTIQYNYDFAGKKHDSMLLYREDEDKAETAYNKLVRKNFETYLVNSADARALGAEISDRFSVLRETVQVGVGYDTSVINLLDTVELEMKINGRVFSKNSRWIVKETDPAQDILTLEAII
jgi:hypothetical protein